jgi:hypothetical protein
MTTPKKKGQVRAKCTDSIFEKCSPYLLLKQIPKGASLPPDHHTNERLDAVVAHSTHELLTKNLKVVFHLADNGDARAIEIMVRSAFLAAHLLDRLVEKNPTRLHSWSHSEIRWPSFIGKKKVFEQRRERFIEVLELSKTCPLDFKWEPNSPATQSAHQMIEWLERNQIILNLPALSKGTRKTWFEIGWKALLERTGSHPERDPYLRSIGFYQADREWRERGFTKQTQREDRAQLEVIIQRRIKAALFQGFNTLTSRL